MSVIIINNFKLTRWCWCGKTN